MLNITLDKSKKRTYTRQIYQAIRNKILAGEVKSGDALPPYRELSQTLAVSKNTILAAYDMLVSDGMLRSVGGSGFYVAEGMKRVSAPVLYKQPESAALSAFVLPDGTINFDNGQPALELFPRAKWNKSVSAAMACASSAALGYDLPQGRPELRFALCDYLRKVQGISCDPEQIIVTSGSKQAIALAAEHLLHGNREVWIEDPVPTLLGQLLSHHTNRISALPVDEYGLNPAEFPVCGNPALIIASPGRQFPIGGVMPMPQRIALIDYVKKRNAFLLEDIFESEFSYDIPQQTSVWELDPERVISVVTFSKVLFPSVRLGCMVVPHTLVSELCDCKRLSDHHTNSIYQLALADFIKSGELYKHIRRMQKVYRKRRDFLIDCLNRQFGDRAHVRGSASGMNLIVSFSDIDFTENVCQRLLEKGVYALPVKPPVCSGKNSRSALILRYTGLTEDEIRLGVTRLFVALS